MIGETGSGKSTLLKQMLPDLTVGKVTAGGLITSFPRTVDNFAYVSQFVDNQMIMETPRDELKFVLDNQGCSQNEIQLRITEIASYLGIISLLDTKSEELSGGQKQLVNLASALILKPKVLLLDEPTAQLDPIASEKLMQIVQKVNEELDMTIVLVEHEINQEIRFANRFLIMEDGKLILNKSVEDGLQAIYLNIKYRNYLTQIDRLYLELGLKSSASVPLSNKQLGQIVLKNKSKLQFVSPKRAITEVNKIILDVNKLNFRFDFNGRQVIDNVSFKLRQGASYCVVGPNGMGKTTLLKVITQQLKKQSGRIEFNGKKLASSAYQEMFVLPQNPAALFMKDTVKDELLYQLGQNQSDVELENVLNKYSLAGLENVSPYDLSGGQQEFLALALGFIKNPQILFLDEPTKGLDPNKRIKLGEMLRVFQANGGTIFTNSHDLLFAAKYSDQVAMMFDGKLSEFSDPVTFFENKFFYTTEINKALRNIFPAALSWEDIQKSES